MILAAFFVLAEGNLPRAETYRIEEPCGIALIGACLPRRVATWERTQGAVVEATQGFTLIELSIVLVVIGLIVGGILVGQDLIGAAATRAQIAQIEKFNAAVNTFRNKYNAIPGDMDPVSAASFGFTARTGAPGNGDANGILDGSNSGNIYHWNQNGENLLFWEDLTSANMLAGSFSTYVDGNDMTCTSATICSLYIPSAKIGNGNFIYTYSGTVANAASGTNYFGLSQISAINNDNLGTSFGSNSSPGLTVSQAYNIDKKIDDGMPTTGSVIVQYLGGANGWQSFSPSANPDTASTCYNSSTNTYSTNVSNGSNPNCALSFQMQGAAR